MEVTIKYYSTDVNKYLQEKVHVAKRTFFQRSLRSLPVSDISEIKLKDE